MRIRDRLWLYIHRKNILHNDIKKFLHIAKPQDFNWWNECNEFYKDFNVKDKIVFDIGSDIGVSPMYFLSKGAKFVMGYSLEKPYFTDKKYVHNIMKVSGDTINSIYQTTWQFKKSEIVLKADCEGCEWDFPMGFLDQFSDWVIALHNPVKSDDLFGYIKNNGKLIGSVDNIEFVVYQKL